MATKKTTTNQLTLAEIRSSLEEVEKRRAASDISEEERAALEEASLTLRNAERAAITDVQNGIIKDFEEETKQVKLQAKEINGLIAKLNRLPKALETTQKVIKECVRVLKAIAKWTLVLCWILLIASCATMSKSQLQKVRALSISSDTVSLAPQMLFEKIADVRMERGLIYTASLDGTENRIAELNSIVKGSQEDSRIVSKSGVYVNVLNSYIKALQSLASDTRWKKNGTQLQGIGRNVDSLFIAYNKTGWGDEIPTGLSKQLGRSTGYVSQEIGKRVQYRKMKQVLECGDSLVSQCCDALVQILKKEGVSQLIENEEKGLEMNYGSYLKAMSRRGENVSMDTDRKYVELKRELEGIHDMQSKCAKSLTSLKNAHHKLLLDMDKGRKYNEISDEMLELSEEAQALCSMIRKLDK